MEYVLLGWPEDGPTLRLDYEQFSYAGKFVMSSTGKAVARAEDIVAAVAFDADRTDEQTLRLRYVTVRRDRQGEAIGPRLLRFVAERALERDFECVCIAVNNPFAFEASYRAGFAYTGERTGLAELVCSCPVKEVDAERYQSGLDRYRERDLSAAEETFLERKRDGDPPSVVEVPQQ